MKIARQAHRCRLTVALGALSALSVLLHAQPGQLQPTFETRVDYVAVPVRVLDARGEFVRGLSVADFHLREDGKPHEIATLAAIDIPLVGASHILASGNEPISADRLVEVQGRVYAIVVDDLFLEPADTLKVRKLVRAFVHQKMSANDVAAIALTSVSTSPLFTRDGLALSAVLERVVGAYDPAFDGPAAVSFRRRARSTVLNMLESLAVVRNRQKALVLVSPSGTCVLVRDMTGHVREDSEPVSCEQMFDTAVRAGVTIYTMDPRGARVPPCAKAEWSGETCSGRSVAIASARWHPSRGIIRTLADETGGFAVESTNNFGFFFDRIVRENSAYYLIGYYSANSRVDGKFRKHDVQVNRRGVRVIHRTGYLALHRQN